MLGVFVCYKGLNIFESTESTESGASVYIHFERRIALFMLVALLIGCGASEYRQAFSSRSPKGQAEIRLLRNFPESDGDYFFRVEAIEGDRHDVILQHDLDSSIGLVESYWTPEGNRVALLVCEMFGGTAWLAYDFTQHVKISPELFRPLIENKIRQQYSLGAATNVLEWACSEDGRSAYRKTHDVR